MRTCDYRNLSEVDKALKLVKEKEVSMAVAAQVVGVDVGRVKRAKKANKENRCVGVVGRPKLLSSEGEAKLVDTILEADNAKKALSYQKVKEKVCTPFMQFICVFIHHFTHNSYIYYIYRLKIYTLINLTRI
jgi:hypothetical protein